MNGDIIGQPENNASRPSVLSFEMHGGINSMGL